MNPEVGDRVRVNISPWETRQGIIKQIDVIGFNPSRFQVQFIDLPRTLDVLWFLASELTFVSRTRYSN